MWYRIHALVWLLALALIAAACSPVAPPPPGTSSSGQAGQTTSERVRIGTQPWIGYGPWWIAQERGLFDKYGLDVELVEFIQDQDVNAALASGDMDAANLATHTAIKLFGNGLEIRIVLLEDASYEADAILAGADIQAIADLKGVAVAYEEGSTSDLLLNYALAQNGMSIQDVQPVPMPASDAGAALIAGRVEAAVTYEPYISEARAQNPDLHLLYTAAERPGLISDVLAVSAQFAQERPETVRALLAIWDEAMAFYNANPEEGRAIISRAVGSDPQELATAFDGVEFFDLAANREQLTGDFRDTIQDVAEVSLSIGLISEIPDLDALIDPAFLE